MESKYHAKTCVNSTAEKLNNGTINLREARERLCHCGHFNYLPSDKECINYLNEWSEDGVDTREVAKRELDTMLEKVNLMLVWEMDGTYMIYDHEEHIVSPSKFYDEMVDDYGNEVRMATEEEEAVIMDERFGNIYEMLI